MRGSQTVSPRAPEAPIRVEETRSLRAGSSVTSVRPRRPSSSPHTAPRGGRRASASSPAVRHLRLVRHNQPAHAAPCSCPQHRLAGWIRARVVGSTVGTQPPHLTARLPAEPPAVLVHEPVVKGADQYQVRQVRRAASRPPHDVMGLRELAGSASGEPALAVAVAKLARHGRRRLPRDPTERKGLPALVLDHRLDPPRAGKAPNGLGVEHPAVLE